jgi:hypothetical protein
VIPSMDAGHMTLNDTAGVTTMVISAYQVCTKPTNP